MKIRLTVEYDGTDFHGWQMQPGLRTVQAVLEEALAAMMDQTVRVIGSGRTDAGVHALAQVAHCRVPKPIPPWNIAMGLNSVLPRDVRVTDCREAPENFHAQYGSTGKRYRYLILNRRMPSALLRHRAWHVWSELDVEAMEKGALHLVGRHDFTSFRSAGEKGSSVREVRELTIARDGEIIRIEISANGFLKHMVRNITGALVEVGLGRLRPEGILELREGRTRHDAPRKAPPQGLTLVEVYYPDSPPPSK